MSKSLSCKEPLLGNQCYANVRAAGRVARHERDRVSATGRTGSAKSSSLTCRCSGGRPDWCGASNAGVAPPVVVAGATTTQISSRPATRSPHARRVGQPRSSTCAEANCSTFCLTGLRRSRVDGSPRDQPSGEIGPSNQHDRLVGLLRAGDPKQQVWFPWNAKEMVRQTYAQSNPELADASVAEIVRDFADESMPTEGVIIWSNASREQRRVWTGQLPTPPRALPAPRQQTRLDPPQHDPTLKRGEPHIGRAARVVIAIRNQPGQSPTPFTFTSGKPTSNSHMRVGSVSNRGSANSDDVEHRQIRRAPVSRPGCPPRPHPTVKQKRDEKGPTVLFWHLIR